MITLKETHFMFDSRDLEKALKALRPETTRGDLDVLFNLIQLSEKVRKKANVNINTGDCQVTYFKGAQKLIGG